jgi:single-strand DNA-binding protein
MDNTDNHKLTQRGIIHKIYDAEQKTEKFKVRNFVIKIPSPHYEQYAKFQLIKDRCDLIEPYVTGEEVIVYFDIHGREWKGDFYTNLSAWRIKSAEVTEQHHKPPTTKAAAPTIATLPEEEESADDDLPF